MENKIKLGVFVLLLTSLLGACAPASTADLGVAIPSASPTTLVTITPNPAPTSCVYEMFTTVDLPELTKEWQARLTAAGIQATETEASYPVEPYVCYRVTTNGYEEVSRTDEVSGGIYWSAIIPVKDTADAEVEGDLVRMVIEIVQSIKDTPYPLEGGGISLDFMADKDHIRLVRFHTSLGLELYNKGLRGAALLNPLEKSQF